MKKQALLIGINNYSEMGSLNNLNYARQDAEAISDALQMYYGFRSEEITLMTCNQKRTLSPVTPVSILSKLSPEQFPEPIDLFIFGFWGHGIWDNNVRYLCPMSTYENDLSRTCVSVNDVTQRVSELPIHNACFIFDCCQSLSGRGAEQYVVEQELTSLQNLGRDIVFKGKKLKSHPETTFERNVAILNSCCQGQIAYEWDDKKHGIFTAHLLEAMKMRMKTVNEWAAHLANKVSKTADQLGKKAQTPFYSLEGCIELPVVETPVEIPPRTTKPVSAPAPAPVVNKPNPASKIGIQAPSPQTVEQATLKLIELFQETVKIYENEIVKQWLLRQKKELVSIYTALANQSITSQSAFSQLFKIAQNAGVWIKANRSILGGKKLVYTSYAWYSWADFAQKNKLEFLSQALNP